MTIKVSSDLGTSGTNIPLVLQSSNHKLQGVLITKVDAAARDAIPVTLLVQGSLVYLSSDGTYWRWEDSAWVEHTFPHTPGTVPNDYHFFIPGTPTESQLLGVIKFVRAGIIFEDGLSGSLAEVTANPADSFVCSIEVFDSDGVSVITGSLTIDTDGTYLFSDFDGGYMTSIGDKLVITAPASADASIQNLAITLAAKV
jgi:hypothetical protein